MSGPGPWFSALRADLESARLAHGALQMMIDEGDDCGDHVGIQRHRRAIHDGQAEMLKLWQDSLGRVERGETEPPPLPTGVLLRESSVEQGQALVLAKRAKALAAAPEYDEEAIRETLWALVDAVVSRAAHSQPGSDA